MLLVRIQITRTDGRTAALGVLQIVNDATGDLPEDVDEFEGVGHYDVELLWSDIRRRLRVRVEDFDRSRGALALIGEALDALESVLPQTRQAT